MIRYIFIFLAFTLGFSTVLSAQKKDFDTAWIQIETLESEGKVKTALEKVQALHLKATKQKNKEQILKTLLFRWKFLQIVDEKSQVKILEEVHTEISQQQFPVKQFLHLYMASFLETYLNDNYWKVNNRTTTENAALKNYQTWDQTTFLNEISAHYKNAQTPYLGLATLPTEKIAPLLVTVPINRKYKPTAYDIIAHKALAFYKNTRNRVQKPKDEFLIDSDSYFNSSATFAKQNIKSTDAESLLYKALKTYQQLEQIHSQQKNDVAWSFNSLERMQFVKNNYTGINTPVKYLDGLQQLQAEFKRSKETAEIELAVAKAYRELSFQKNEENTFIYPNYNKKALALLTKIETDKAAINTIIEAKNLKQQILQRKLIWLTQDKHLPNQPHLAKITFTNAHSATVKAYRVPGDYDINSYNYSKKDSLIKIYLSKRKLAFSKTYLLPKKEDHHTYSTEVVVPKLPLGNYLLQIQTDTLTNSLKYHKLQVTELSVNKTTAGVFTKYQVLNQYTGKTIIDASVVVKTPLDRRKETYRTSKYNTNSWGEFSHKTTTNYVNNSITISTINDTLKIEDYNYGTRQRDNYLNELNTYKSKTLLFLDRAIYRPKQTVYFKAIAVSEVAQKSSVIENKPIEITVTNTNNEKIYTTTQTTNEYGSIKGKFKLPNGGLNGNFTITASIVKPKNSKNNQRAYQNFSVEEYKRPTFEVSFLPATKIYKPLDSIKVNGNATAFLGSSITDATVNYSVKRTTQHRFWWYRNRSNDAKQIATATVKTDEKGDFSILFKAETDEEDTDNKIYNYTIEAKITDLNGETRENTITIKVADKNLLATINTPEDWNGATIPELSVSVTDVNGNPIKVNGTIKVYKLQSTGRFLNERPWPTPDIQTITETQFKQSFPHIPFTNEKDSKNWKKGKLFFENSFSATDKPTIEIIKPNKWPAGKYVLITTVTDPNTKSTVETEKAITLEQPKQEFPADEELFAHQTNYNKNDPSALEIKLQTAAPELIVFAEVFDGGNSIWKEKITLKKGSKKQTIKLSELTYPKVTVVYKYQVYNKFYTEQELIDFIPKPVTLQIEKKHFTDKINPGIPEKWSFSIQRSDNKTFNAEALASMYDASLDTFKKSYWNTSFGFGKSYPSPALSTNINPLRTSSISFNEHYNTLSKNHFPLENLNFYGFEFNRINSWKYKKYLKLIKFKIKTRNPKTIYGIVIGHFIPQTIVTNKRTLKTTSINNNGEFEIEAKKGDSLSFKFNKLITKEIIVSNTKELLEISFSNKISNRSKKQYGSKTNSLRSYKKELNELNEWNQSDSELELSGRAQGVVVSNSTNNKNVLIRGLNTFGDGKPLYIVDGVLVSDIGNIDPYSLGNIKILKDTAATSIYGSRASNGVILITLKDGIDIKSLNLDVAPLEDFKTFKARKKSKETAFFLPNLRTTKKGEIEFEFTSPEALTRWNFRMLAHTKEAIVGRLNAQTLTQKELSIIPNAPRFVREGDQLRFTAKVANLTSKKMTGTAQLQWTDPITGNTLNKQLAQEQLTQNFSVDANGNSLLSWLITIPENLTSIQYKIIAKANNFTDGEEKIIPVLSNRMLVTESVPLWVRAGETASFSLANFEPSSNTQKPHQITLEYTSNPAWMAIKSLPYLMEYPHQCSEQTFARLYANTMAAHILNTQPKIKTVFESWRAKGTLKSPLETNEELKSILLAESPWLQEAKSESEQQQRLATLFDLEKTAKAQQKNINKLRQLQKSNGGFPWFKGGYVNSYITRHIVAGFGHLEKLGVTNQQVKTDNIVKNAIRFMDNELVKNYINYQKHHKTDEGFYKQIRLLHFAYARSFYKDRFPLKGQAKTIINKALVFQEMDWTTRSIYEKGILALVLHRFKNSNITQKILTSLTESAVNSKENGMYWKENTNSWWWYQNPITTQALLIEAYTETKQPEKYVEEMKIFLLKNKRTNRWETTIETTNATYALLLQGKDWLSIKDNTVIKVGTTKIATKKLLENQKEQGTGYFKTTWKADEISSQFKTVEINNKSTVTGYGGYYWQYFENLDAIKVDNQNPLSIDKELYKKVTTDKGTELKKITSQTPLQIGDKVTVRLLIKSDDDLEFVHLKDMRASGFEPTKVLSGYEYNDGLGYYQSTKNVASHFFIDTLPKGNYVLEYDVIANQAGSFSNGITSLQCMYAPEFNSHSAGQLVNIKE